MNRIKSLIYFPAYVARKYLIGRGEPRFALFLTIVAVCGVAIGVAALIVVISVMAGFGRDLESKLMGFNPHVTVECPASGPVSAGAGRGCREVAKRISSNFEGVEEVNPFVIGEVVIQAPGAEGLSAMGAKVFGLSRIPARMFKTAKLYWGGGIYGRPWWLSWMPPLKRGVVLGQEMLYQIGVHPDFGDRVQLIAPFGGIDPLGNPAPVRREYQVVGGFRSGFFEYDVKYVLMSIDEAERLLKNQGRYGLQIMLSGRGALSPRSTGRFVADLQRFLGPAYEVTAWTKKNKRLFAALKLERIAMTFLLFLIIVIASFSVVGVTLMIFFSKRRDLAVLMAMGASKRNISRIFLFHGGWIGLSGALLGSALGIATCFVIKRSDIVLPPSYYLDYLPVAIDGSLILLVALGGIIMSVAAAFYPARRAAETDPVALLRYE